MPNVILWKRSEIAELRDRMEDVFERFFGELPDRHFLPVTGPISNWQASEDEKEIVIKMELPHMSPENVEIHLNGDLLTIQIRKEEVRPPDEATDTTGKKLNLSITRSVRLPRRVKRDEIQANYSEGVLKITLPKGEKPPFKIQIKD